MSKVDQHPSSSHYLVEISNRANTALENLLFCKDHIAYPMKEMLVLLKILREPSMFVEEDRVSMLKRVVQIVLSNDNNFSTKEDCLRLSIDVMLSNKVNGIINSSTNRWNRSDTRNQNIILDKLKTKRGIRLKKEICMHLKMTTMIA